MKLIRNLNRRLSKNGKTLESWAVFWCDFCKLEVEKRLSDGYKCKSCGCHINIKHGEYDARLYRIWQGMKGRCLNQNNQAYKYYGGRGIMVCTEWTGSYIVFRDWALSNGYANNLEIDRIYNDGNYEPSNCQWITHKFNMRNSGTTKINIEQANEIRKLYNTGNYIQQELGKKYHINTSIISDIINNKIWK